MNHCRCSIHYPENLAIFCNAINEAENEGYPHVEFSPLPFHRMASVLIPTTKIVFRPLLNITRIFDVSCQFGGNFYLSVSDIARLCKPFIKENRNKKIEPCKLQIRIGEYMPELGGMSEILPHSAKAWINSKPVPMDVIRSPLVLNAIDYLHINTVNINTIRFLFPPSNRIYYMVVYLVDVIGVEELMKEIEIDNNRFLLPSTTRETATKLLISSGRNADLESHKISLLCPISKIRMTLPAKSIKCNHLQCFDMQAFISSNKVEPSWMCPICMKLIDLDDVKIDTLLLSIIKSTGLPKTCKKIELYANGNWKPCILNCDGGEGFSGISGGPSKKTILTIDLGNSDDEDLGYVVRTVLPITNLVNSDDSKSNICMDTTTYIKEENDSEEDQPPLKVIKKEEPED